MRIIKQDWGFEEEVDGYTILEKIERAGRTCYKSEERITTESAKKFIAGLIKSGHHSVLEHHNLSVRIITDRGVTHEIVRHRLASYSQESTRYCNYAGDKFGNEITVILPVWFDNVTLAAKGFKAYNAWNEACKAAEAYYMQLLQSGQSAQQARSVLPNSLKTEIVMTCNLREWRHFFTLRCSSAAHPQMQDIARKMLKGFQLVIPVLFDDIVYEHTLSVQDVTSPTENKL